MRSLWFKDCNENNVQGIFHDVSSCLNNFLYHDGSINGYTKDWKGIKLQLQMVSLRLFFIIARELWKEMS